MYKLTSFIKLIQCFFLYFSIFLSIINSTLASELEIASKTNATYIAALENAIIDYKVLAANGGWKNIKIGKSIKLNMHDERIPTIRETLTIMGDYKPTESNDSDKLDEALLEAVKHFQTRHGLEPDGAIGKKTQIALSIPAESRIEQMQRTIKKMEEMPDLGDRYILVNVAGYYLKAIDKNALTLNSRVIVGNIKNKTPLFHSEITDISFNPQWHVPQRIAREEIIKKQRQNTDYLSKGNYAVTNQDGETVDIENVNWNSSEANNYHYTQRSGEKNALGKVKFNLPDTDSIYLHSTGSPKLFTKAERALSHGCIRVAHARELIDFVLAGQEGWSAEKIAKSFDSSTTKTAKVANPVPVHLVYWTSWVDDDSKQPYFFPDIYGKDK